MATINLGILAHVDAGKTSLTENILFQTGVIKTIGRVDHGDTQTDSLELERARGITIKSAVVSFQLGDLTVNLIDTPGHADFIAEVERSLHVLDGVVLVVSAVEGIQPQTRRLCKAIRTAGIPMMIFINKIDRVGARESSLLCDIRTQLDLRLAPMNTVAEIGTHDARVAPFAVEDRRWRIDLAEALAESSDTMLAEFIATDGNLPLDRLLTELRIQTADCRIAPVYFGSALLGIGVNLLLDGAAELLPPTCADEFGPLTGRIFKIQRTPTGEKIVFARIFSGSVAVRQRITLVRAPASEPSSESDERVTGIERFCHGTRQLAPAARAGDIVCLHGLRDARIGDAIGAEPDEDRNRHGLFTVPSLESVINPAAPAAATSLHAALQLLAEQDPLISLRVNERSGELSLRLYGEVQKDVIAETLKTEFGLETLFGPSRPICIERPLGTGFAVEHIDSPDNAFYGTVGIRIEPGRLTSGITYRHEPGSLPPAYYRVIEETVYSTLTEGLCGWNVTDCIVTLVDVGYSAPVTTGTDFRKLVPLVVLAALDRAQTVVCEPVEHFDLTVPTELLGAILNVLGAVRGIPLHTVSHNGTTQVTGTIPTESIHTFEQRIVSPGRGEALFSSAFESYQPVTGHIPTRPRHPVDPRNRKECLAAIGRHRLE